MSTQSVAERLIQLCREGKNMDAIEELYSEDIVSSEIEGTPDQVTRGKEAILKKNTEWLASVQEFHSGEVSDPVVAGNHFSCSMSFDVTFRELGRMQMEEICVFKVANDKIVAEQFFYDMPAQ
jgi:ketosteroid isomerase-like protein